MKTVKNLNELYNAVSKDEKVIRIEDPARAEYVVLCSPNINFLKETVKGGAKGLGIGAVGLAIGGLLGGFPAIILGMGGMLVGGARAVKALTWDLVKGLKTDGELEEAKKGIIANYKGIDFKKFDKFLKLYKISSKGNSYIELTHS